MPDRDKVVEALEICTSREPGEYTCNKCHYETRVDGDGCEVNLMLDAIALLKAYEAERLEWIGAVAKLTAENELLKEQEAKVLTVDQLEDALDTVVWLETPVSENLADGYSLIMAYSHKDGYMFFESPFGDNPSQDILEYSEYGKSWRCWDKRPTDEQRQAVTWDGY